MNFFLGKGSLVRLLLVGVSLLAAACQGDPAADRDAYYSSANSYLEEGKPEEASVQFRNALQADPNHVESYIGLGDALERTGDFSGAFAAFQKALSIDGKSVPAKLRVGRYALQSGSLDPKGFARARELAEEVLAVQPDNVEARILLGNAFGGLQDLNLATKEMEAVLAEDPDNLPASLNLGAYQLGLKNMERAEEVFIEAVQKHPDSVQARLALANFYGFSGKLGLAEEHFKAALEMEPDNQLALFSLVRFHLISGKRDEAEKTLQASIAANPEAREARWLLANFHLEQGKTEEGIKELRALVEADPDNSRAALRLAEVHLLILNDDATASEMIEAQLKRNRNDPTAHMLKGRLLHREGKRDEALAELDQALRIDGRLTQASLEKASILIEQADLKSSAEILRDVLKLQPSNLAARAGLAKVLALQQFAEEALLYATEVLDRLPDNEDALAARAIATLSLQRFPDSKADFQKLTELKPENPFYWHRLATVETLLGDEASGLRHFRKCLEINPDLADATNDILFLHLKKKDYSAAFAELDQLSRRAKQQDQIHVFRARLYSAMEDTASAEKEFREAIAFNPENYQAYVLLAQLNLLKNDVDQALAEADALIAKDPDFPVGHLLRGYYLDVKKDVPGAVASYRRAFQLDPNNSIAANNLAWLLAEHEIDLTEALEMAQAARKLDPKNAQFADTLGWVHYKRKNYLLARDQLLFSVNNGQPTAEHYYRLGLAYAALGDRPHATQTLRKALEMDANFNGADRARETLKTLG